ncbi:DoxX family protein [Psychrobacter glaciei]
MAILAGGAEFFGGLALVLGLLTRPAALVAAFTMLVAIFSVHISNGLFAADGGYEYALVLMVALLALAVQGGGSLSLDKALSEKIGSVK